MAKKLFHWLYGGTSDLKNSLSLVANNDASVLANSSRHSNQQSAFQVGDPNTANSSATYYAQGGNLSNVGTGDMTVAFWWKPGTRSFVSNPHMNVRTLFNFGPIQIANNPPSGMSESSFDLRAYFKYDDGGGNAVNLAKTWRLDLTGSPWIHIYASRIDGVFSFVLSDVNGNVLTDTSNASTTWTSSLYQGVVYDSVVATPRVLIGGNFAVSKSPYGLYDDIFLLTDHGVAYDDLLTHEYGFHKINPILNSYYVNPQYIVDGSGDTVDVSWDIDWFGPGQGLFQNSATMFITETGTGIPVTNFNLADPDSGTYQDTPTESRKYQLRYSHYYGDGEVDIYSYVGTVPVIDSFSSSHESATNGTSVTLSWNTTNSTSLSLLKYVGGLLTNTETVTGLVSKSVTISETVSYKLRATNSYGSVDSSSVEIQLSQGGNNMSKISAGAAGLVLQKGMVTSSVELGASLMVSGVGGGSDLALNVALASLSSSVVASDAAVAAEAARALTAEAAIQADVDQNESDADAAIAAEETRALAAEAALQADVDGNEADADAAIAAVAADLVSEAATARAAESANAAAIVAEAATARAAEAALQADVDQNESDADAAIAAVAADLVSEAATARGAESANATAISAEATRALAAEAALQADVDQNESDADAAIAAEETRALAAEAALQADVDGNEADADAAIAAVAADLVSEAATARAAESANAAAIVAEAATARAAEAALQADVDQNESDADAAIAAVAADLVSEAATARAAESANAAAIVAEAATARAAESALQADVDGNEADADALFDKHETSIGLAADGGFPGFALSSYMAAATDLMDGMTKLDVEVAANAFGVTTNQADIATETARAMAAELVLTNDLGTEVARAIAAENANSLAISNEVADRVADVSAEEGRAMAAEIANLNAISAEESRAIAAEGLLDVRQTIMESTFAFTGDGAGGGILLLTDQGLGGDVVALTFAVDNGVKMLTIS
jgi:hypothetical protein